MELNMLSNAVKAKPMANMDFIFTWWIDEFNKKQKWGMGQIIIILIMHIHELILSTHYCINLSNVKYQ